MINRYTCYTDGSASIKGEKLGGFGVYILHEDGEERFFRKGFSNTKTGRMELNAIIFCLKQIEDKTSLIHIYSDSEYVVKCVSERRLWHWKKLNWIGIKNPDLMIQFYEEILKFKQLPKVYHVKGHTGFDDVHSLGNSIVDQLANYKTQKSYEIDLAI